MGKQKARSMTAPASYSTLKIQDGGQRREAVLFTVHIKIPSKTKTMKYPGRYNTRYKVLLKVPFIVYKRRGGVGSLIYLVILKIREDQGFWSRYGQVICKGWQLLLSSSVLQGPMENAWQGNPAVFTFHWFRIRARQGVADFRSTSSPLPVLLTRTTPPLLCLYQLKAWGFEGKQLLYNGEPRVRRLRANETQ